ncbi:MAG: 2-dehydro-3-deoxyphosphogluconate aldolase [Phycisphaerales bacterium]|nr:2-dehydro-3-deoxyphosphogluconate aldolase [Phycisphaerales bacterium]
MANRNRNEVVQEIQQRRLSAIIRTKDEAVARDAMTAAVAGGFRVIEFTLTTPNALRLIERFAANDDLLVGAGTVLTVDQARDSVRAGACFLVSPVFDPAILGAAAKLGVAFIPGAFTPTEMLTAHRAGADFVKLFPAPADVVEYVTGILAPLPELRIFPTAGVSLANCVEVLKAGAAGAGFVRTLFEPGWMAERNYASIERRAAEIVDRCRAELGAG